MKSYITHLYEMDLHQNESNPPIKHSYLENMLYDELKDIPTKEQYNKGKNL